MQEQTWHQEKNSLGILIRYKSIIQRKKPKNEHSKLRVNRFFFAGVGQYIRVIT